MIVAAYTLDDAGILQRAANDSFSQSGVESFTRVSIVDVFSNPPEPQQYIWGGRIPVGELTLLAAHGGTGKSTFALQLAAHVANDTPFLGLMTGDNPMKTLFFSAEDGKDTIRRRMAAICQADGLDPVEIDKNLIVIDATEVPCLFEETHIGGGVKQARETGNYDKLKQFIKDEGIKFLIVDNASDTFGANPIDRQAVTQFIRALTRLVRDVGGAVLLLAHVNKMTSKAGKNQTDTEGYADSAAWHNASRSRLFLNAKSEGNLTLEHQKNNLGIKQPVLNIAFRDDGSSFHVIGEEQLQKAKEEKAESLKLSQPGLLKLIHEFYERGEFISASTASTTTNAHAKLSKENGYPFKSDKTGKDDCFTVLRECEREGFLTKTIQESKHRNKSICWKLTPEGLDFINVSA